MGEIGIPRHEFLYDLRFWEVRRIIRGYRRRNRLNHQLLAECAYASIFAMRDPEGKKVSDIFPALFEDDEEDNEPEISEQEVDELKTLMASINKQNSEA